MKIQRKHFLLLGILIALGIEYTQVSAAFQQQGFSQFQELDGKVAFECQSQCFILGGNFKDNDYIRLQGGVQGEGMIGYGFAVGQQIIPGESLQVNGMANVDNTFTFTQHPYYAQIPKDAQILFIVQGNIVANYFTLDIGYLGAFQRIAQGWKDFWTAEPYGFYSINLLYGPKMMGASVTTKFSIWFVLLSIILFIYLAAKKKQKMFKTYFIYLAAIFFSIIGLRFVLVDAYNIVKTDYKTFVSQPDEKKIFRNYNDIYAFDQFIKNNVEKGEKINFISYQPWPFPGFSEYQLRPDIQFDTGANILAVYDVGTMKVESGTLINMQDGKVLFTGLYDIKYFNNFSFIAKK